MNSSGYDIVKLVPELEYKMTDLLQAKTGMSLDWHIPFFSRRRIPRASEALEKLHSNKAKHRGENSLVARDRNSA